MPVFQLNRPDLSRSGQLPLITLLLLALLPNLLKAQGETKLSTEIHGFVKSDLWWDSRRIVGAREELLLLIPEKIKTDSFGNDINARPGLGFSAITSRINLRAKGVKAFGALAEGFIEADFSGVSNADINTFRLRHAYLKLRWDQSQLLFGQYWHPSFTPEAFPELVSLNTGAPFQPFIRSPLVQWNYYGGMEVLLAAIGQRDYANDGPSGRIPDYLRYAGFPNLHVQLKLAGKNAGVLGLGLDYKRLRPQALSSNSAYYKAVVDSWALMVFGKYRGKNWSLAGKAILGQNMTEHLLLGGYALAIIDTTTSSLKYTPSTHLFTWANLIVYPQGKPGRRIGLFAGYAKNLGTNIPNLGVFYGRGYDIAAMYRFSGFLAWRQGPVELSCELEYTRAFYGTPDNFALVQNTYGVGNFRPLICAFYFF
jgi:hypothetical protein